MKQPVTVCMEKPVLSSPETQIAILANSLVRDKKPTVIPVFFSFFACPFRCIFCAQTAQTGQNELPERRIVPHLIHVLRQALSRNPSLDEVALYGGTFTMWPISLQIECLRLIRRLCGPAVRIRCSTRPDALPPALLRRLATEGMTLIEVGVQTFSDGALAAVRRGYDGDGARRGCREVLAAGLELGIQLMPGLPGGTREDFLADVRAALALGACCLRFYPCLVMSGTQLADWWRQGRYAPWKVADAVAALGRGLALAWAADVPVIRIGLAPGPDLQAAILDGPWHPSLGSLVQAEALACLVEDRAGGRAPRSLHLPAACRGFMGAADSPVRRRLAGAGLFNTDIVWHDGRGAWLKFG
jgi:histone acetyltransferase (RNA polymerase elongator complex component)